MLYCHILSEAKAARDQGLRKEKGLTGLPGLVFLDADGDVLVRVPYDKVSVKGISATGDRALRYIDLRARAARGEDDARAAFLQMQLEERQIDLKPATAEFAEIEVMSDAQRAVLEELLLSLRISTELRAAGQKGRRKLGPKYWAMWRDGPRPGASVSRGYWYAILEWAEHDRKLDVFAAAIAEFEAVLKVSDPGATWVRPLLDRYEKRLAELRRESRSR